MFSTSTSQLAGRLSRTRQALSKTYWPLIIAMAASLHQLASAFGITPDAHAAATLSAAVAEGRRIVDQVNAARLAVAAGSAPSLPAALQSAATKP
ncbi:MAG: hypothetical protein INR62_02695 [Rhodospirillales bacterium]|nr:hypothetical protein [Acetobacter sp.]